MKYAGLPLLAAPGNVLEPILHPGEHTEHNGGVLAERVIPFEPQDIFPHPPAWLRDRTVKPGHLFWPVGATRFAFGTFLIARDSLDEIRARANQGGYHAELFESYDGTRRFITRLWMLPTPPLLQAGPCQCLHLLTLVDERWFWANQRIKAEVSAGETTWAQLIAQVGAALGITIYHSTIEPAFLRPPEAFNQDGLPAAALLDRIAHSLGRRVVRGLDGTVKLQTPPEAGIALFSNMNVVRPVMAGSLVQGGLVQGQNADTAPLLPRRLTFTFPIELDGQIQSAPFELEVTMASLGLTLLAGLRTSDQNVLVPFTAVAIFDDTGTFTNRTELIGLARAWASYYYLWRLRGPEWKFAGHHDWSMEGYHDVEWLHRWAGPEDGELSTRLMLPEVPVPAILPGESCCAGVGDLLGPPVSPGGGAVINGNSDGNGVLLILGGGNIYIDGPTFIFGGNVTLDFTEATVTGLNLEESLQVLGVPRWTTYVIDFNNSNLNVASNTATWSIDTIPHRSVIHEVVVTLERTWEGTALAGLTFDLSSQGSTIGPVSYAFGADIMTGGGFLDGDFITPSTVPTWGGAWRSTPFTGVPYDPTVAFTANLGATLNNLTRGRIYIAFLISKIPEPPA